MVSIYSNSSFLKANYDQSLVLVSILPFSPPKRQDMQMQIRKLEESGTVLASIENLLDAFQLHNDFILQITGC
jgi:exoribonuclease R